MAVPEPIINRNVQYIYQYIIKTLKLSQSIACGILANIHMESTFNPDAKNKSSGAYGLCQWLGVRQESLRAYTVTSKKSLNTIDHQMAFVGIELRGTEKKAYEKLTEVDNISPYEAGYRFCYWYERPENKQTNSDIRGQLAKKYYDKISNSSEFNTAIVGSLGDSVAELAMKLAKEHKENGSHPYKKGGYSPGGFDDSGLVYYCYNKGIPHLDTAHYYELYDDTAELVPSIFEAAAGDLVFLRTNGVISSIGIATGTGYVVTVNNSGVVSVGISMYQNRSYSVLRILNQGLGSGSGATIIEGEGEEIVFTGASYVEAVNRFPYDSKISKNLERIQKAGFDYGYLIDIVNGGEFKFYIPEFTESAGANWENIEIVGRSVSVLAYKSTNSRTVDITLELYAGEGVYKKDPPSEDPVGDLHKDANFLRSLEYPDYTHPITRPPSIVQLILGASFSMVGVVSGVSINHMKPLDTQNRAMYLKVSFKVTQIAQDPPDYRDIRDGSYATGIQ